MVDSEEGHLTGFIEQVGEGDEGVSLLQVEDEHSGDEGHALHLNTPRTQTPDQHQRRTVCVSVTTSKVLTRPPGLLTLRLGL